jgi:hypothetical protein
MNSMIALMRVGMAGYIDPNAGGWIFQMIFPVIVAIGGAWMALRKKASSLFRRLFGPKKKGPAEHK